MQCVIFVWIKTIVLSRRSLESRMCYIVHDLLRKPRTRHYFGIFRFFVMDIVESTNQVRTSQWQDFVTTRVCIFHTQSILSSTERTHTHTHTHTQQVHSMILSHNSKALTLWRKFIKMQIMLNLPLLQERKQVVWNIQSWNPLRWIELQIDCSVWSNKTISTLTRNRSYRTKVTNVSSVVFLLSPTPYPVNDVDVVTRIIEIA